MSGWTVATLRAKPGTEYEYSRSEYPDPSHALEDLVATIEEDSRVRRWTIDNPHAYVYFACDRYDWDFAEEFLSDYQVMLKDAVVLGANDTTDTGTARYYPVADSIECTTEYKETQSQDEVYVGRHALNVVSSQHTILARDPFHDWLGEFDERYKEAGTVRLEQQKA